jgi:predicted  nucleic acid-binding Zn-ribbon protein
MSGNERPELRAFNELETLVRHLGEELAVFRRRAISAEAQLKDSGHGGGHAKGGGGRSGRGTAHGERLADLETENDALKTRLDRAEDRVRQMMDRVRFLRQQLQSQATGAGAGAGRS